MFSTGFKITKQERGRSAGVKWHHTYKTNNMIVKVGTNYIFYDQIQYFHDFFLDITPLMDTQQFNYIFFVDGL